MQSLSELKAENAAAEESEVDNEVVEEAAEEETETLELEESETQEVEETREEDETEEVVEDWLKDDNVEPMFKSSDIKAAKTKLKAKLERKHNEETESLKSEIEELKRQMQAPVQTAQPKPRPKYSDFDTDEDYEQALDDWYESKIEAKLQGRDQRSAQESKAREYKQKLVKSVDEHYDRAEKLLQDHSINADVYRQSDENVRRMVESVIPEKGDAVVDQLISNLGEGSEKVMFYVGRNQNALNELQLALSNDKTGISAAMLLGSMKQRIAMPNKRQSQAPKPATQLKGDESAGKSAKSFKQSYMAAHKSKDPAKAFSIRRQAKKAGIDVSSWS